MAEMVGAAGQAAGMEEEAAPAEAKEGAVAQT